MNLRQLKYFVKVVQTGSMTRAAEQLFVAQPALGMQVRQLEEDLGVALLTRHSRGVEPTPAGQALLARAVEILQRVESARREVAAFGAASSEKLRLGLTPALMLVLGPEIAMNVRERVPHVFLSLTEDMSHVLAARLLRAEIDLALAYDVPESPHFQRQPLLHEDLVLVTLPAAGLGATVCFAEALEESLAIPEPGDTIRELVMRTARERGLETIVAYEVRSISAMRSLIARGVAAGILPMAAVAADVAAGKLSARRIVAPSLRRTLFLASLAARATGANQPAVSAVIRDSLRCLTQILGPLAELAAP
jgi:LysR family nitrogen assimilation transcriptional regulator